MKVHEYQAKAIFTRYGVPVPEGGVASSSPEAGEIARRLGGEAVIKAQVHAGGRGKGGGIMVVKDPAEAEAAAARMLGTRLVTPQTGPQGVRVDRVLVEEVASISRELYLAMTVDRAHEGPVVIASASGGMDIEEAAAGQPDKIFTEPVDPLVGFQAFQGRRVSYALNLEPTLVRPASSSWGHFTEYSRRTTARWWR